jgi:hypothetical protein
VPIERVTSPHHCKPDWFGPSDADPHSLVTPVWEQAFEFVFQLSILILEVPPIYLIQYPVSVLKSDAIPVCRDELASDRDRDGSCSGGLGLRGGEM